MRLGWPLTVATLWISLAKAQAPEILGVTNTASYVDPSLPHGGIAQGAMFTIFGRNLGPESPAVVDRFPLAKTFRGVSVRVTVGGVTLDAIPVVVWNQQVSAVLPSNTPTGNGNIQLTYNGVSSNVFPIRIVRHALGIFALNQAGNGPGVFTRAEDYLVNTLTSSARPGEAWDIWATGLGPVQGDEAAQPLPGPLGYNVEVWVGEQRAQVIYAGRSGCCAGIDQIRFIVPEGVSGCYVPVRVLVEGVPSNSVTISIDRESSACSEPGLLTRQQLQEVQQGGRLRVGAITLARSETAVTVPGFGQFVLKTDIGSATFLQYTYDQLIRSGSLVQYAESGGCYVYTFRTTRNEPPSLGELDPIRPTLLDAGPVINVRGPVGNKQLQPQGGQRGIYSAELGGGGTPPFGGGLPDYLEPGEYRVDNGGGGADVGPFQVTATLGPWIQWTNQDQLSQIPLTQPLHVTWTGGTAQDWVMITGSSSNGDAGAAFICGVPASRGSYTVPTSVLAALPPSGSIGGSPQGSLGVITLRPPISFTAAGLDQAWLTFSRAQMKSVSYTR